MNALVKQNASAIALPEDADPWLEIANEGGGQFGKLIKFAKGEWTHKDDEIAIGSEFIAIMDQAMRGWVRFAGGRPVEYRLGRIRDNARLSDRSSLGYTDKAEWERDKRGEAVDPWQQQHYVPMLHCETDELYTWVFSSHGGKQAFRDLARAYSPYRMTSSRPVVSLQRSSYRHETFGKIDVPILKVERFEDSDIGLPASSIPAPANEMDDSTPF
jgi:hypothetical protein